MFDSFLSSITVGTFIDIFSAILVFAGLVIAFNSNNFTFILHSAITGLLYNFLAKAGIEDPNKISAFNYLKEGKKIFSPENLNNIDSSIIPKIMSFSLFIMTLWFVVILFIIVLFLLVILIIRLLLLLSSKKETKLKDNSKEKRDEIEKNLTNIKETLETNSSKSFIKDNNKKEPIINNQNVINQKKIRKISI